MISKRRLANGRIAEVVPLTYGRARICLIDSSNPEFYENQW